MYVCFKCTPVSWQFIIQLTWHKVVFQDVGSFDLFRITVISTESENWDEEETWVPSRSRRHLK